MESLLETCRRIVGEENIKGNALLDKMYKMYVKASKSYVNSTEFKNKIDEVAGELSRNPKRIWVIIQDLFQELKAYKTSTQSAPDGQLNPSATGHDNEDSEPLIADSSNGLSKPASSSNGLSKPSSTKIASQRQIQRLEELLADHHKEIQKFENEELSLDDLENDNSSYLVCERLKKRATKIFKKLCALKNRSTDMGGVREKKFRYSGSRYKELNTHIQRFVNKHSFEERMPDHNDIRRIIKLCNIKYKYHLSKGRINELSKEVFTDVGEILSTLRQQDFVADFGPEFAKAAVRQPMDDPAALSSALRQRLQENKRIAEQNIRAILEKYSEEQTKETSSKLNSENKDSQHVNGSDEGEDDNDEGEDDNDEGEDDGASDDSSSHDEELDMDATTTTTSSETIQVDDKLGTTPIIIWSARPHSSTGNVNNLLDLHALDSPIPGDDGDDDDESDTSSTRSSAGSSSEAVDNLSGLDNSEHDSESDVESEALEFDADTAVASPSKKPRLDEPEVIVLTDSDG